MQGWRFLLYKRPMFRGAENRGLEIPSLPLGQRMALLFLGYFLFAWLGRFLSGDSRTMVNYWLPGGWFVAMLLLSPTRDWPWLMLSAVPANVLFDVLHDAKPDFGIIGFFCVANVTEAGLGAWLVRKFVAKTPTFNSLKEFFGLIFFAGVIGAAAGATIGASMLVHYHLTNSFADSWKLMWGGDAMAVLVLTPLVLSFYNAGKISPAGVFRPYRLAEALLIFVGLAVFLWEVLVNGGGVDSPKVPALIFVLWAGVRFGLRGATAIIFLLTTESAFLTTHYHRGLTVTDLANGDYAFTLQIFVTVAALVGIVPPIVLGERDRTLAKLRESESRFRTLTEAAFEGVFISENGHIVDANDQGLKMFGYTREELNGRDVITLADASSHATVATAIQEEQEEIYGHKLVRRDGSHFLGEARSKTVSSGDRRLRMTALRDITERLNTEQALRESEEKFSKAFRTGPDVMSIADYETNRYLEVNEAHERIFGFKRDEVIGRTAAELGIFKNPPKLGEIRRELKEKGVVRDEEIEGVTRDGRKVALLHSAELIELGGRLCVLRVSHDITERKRAESLTRLQMQVLEMIANGRPLEETLNTLLRMVELQSTEMLTSIQLFDTEGGHMRLCISPSLPPEFAVAYNGVAIGPCAGSCGTAAWRREPVYVADIATDPLWADYKNLALPHGLRACWSTPIFDADKNLLGTFAIYYRHTGLPDEHHRQLIHVATHTAAICIGKQRVEGERAQAIEREQEARIEYTLRLIATQEAERKRIAAELHDSLGQNLLLVKNLAQMAMRQQEPAAAYEQLGTINNLAAQCIAEVRQISRDLHPPQLELLGLKRSLEILMENTDAASDKNFKWKFDDTGKLFPAEAAMNIYRIVQESLNNILKHSRAQNVRVALERDVHEVHLVIADDGCGFTPKKTASVKRGMGLQNIAERVRMLGGKLTLDSAPEHGTRITVAIPVPDSAG